MSTSGYVAPSRHRIHPFTLHRPETIEEAAALLTGLGGGALPMAGGVDVVNWLKAGRRISDLVDIQEVAGLHGISEHEGMLRVQALVTHWEFQHDSRVDAAARGLAAAWAQLGNVRIRMAGTVVGNLLTGASHYDAPPILMALEARAVLADGTQLPLDALPGLGQDRPRSLVTGLELPMRPGQLVAYNRDLKPAVTVAVALRQDDDGLTARMAVGCVLPTAAAAPIDLEGAATAADVAAVAEDASRAAVESLPPFESDYRASAAYRERVTPVLVARELRRLAEAMDTAA